MLKVQTSAWRQLDLKWAARKQMPATSMDRRNFIKNNGQNSF